MDRTINYEFFHWGPYLYRTTISDEELKQVKNLIKNKGRDYRKTLAGLIKKEHKLNNKKLFEIVSIYLQSYFNSMHEHYNKSLPHKGKIKLISSWVNFMTKFESNPLHIHGGDFSFVIVVDIPKDLKEEQLNTVSKDTLPVTLHFYNDVNAGKYSIASHSFNPEIKDFYIFPAYLTHGVTHFQSNGERITVSGNIKITK